MHKLKKYILLLLKEKLHLELKHFKIELQNIQLKNHYKGLKKELKMN